MAGSVNLWYRRTYRLPPNDPRYLELTPFEILLEYHAYKYDDLYSQGKLDGFVEDDEFNLDSVLEEMKNESNWEPMIDDS